MDELYKKPPLPLSMIAGRALYMSAWGTMLFFIIPFSPFYHHLFPEDPIIAQWIFVSFIFSLFGLILSLKGRLWGAFILACTTVVGMTLTMFFFSLRAVAVKDETVTHLPEIFLALFFLFVIINRYKAAIISAVFSAVSIILNIVLTGKLPLIAIAPLLLFCVHFLIIKCFFQESSLKYYYLYRFYRQGRTKPLLTETELH